MNSGPNKIFDLPSLEFLSDSEINLQFATIPNEAVEIRLESAFICMVPLQSLLKGFGYTPNGVKKLDFTRSLFSFEADEIILILRSVHKDVIELNLTDNMLNLFSMKDLHLLFSSLPESIASIILSDNYLELADLITIFSALPRTVTRMDLGCKKCTHHELARILPSHLETLVVNGQELSVQELKKNNRLGNETLFKFFDKDTSATVRANFYFENSGLIL
jgi:hypothetical protein